MDKDKCRICMSDKTDNRSSLFSYTSADQICTISEVGAMFTECLQLELIPNSGYPEMICNYCKLQLSVFHNFLLMAKKSHEKFSESLTNLSTQSFLISEVSEIDEIELYDADSDSFNSEGFIDKPDSNLEESVDETKSNELNFVYPDGSEFKVEYLEDDKDETEAYLKSLKNDVFYIDQEIHLEDCEIHNDDIEENGSELKLCIKSEPEESNVVLDFLVDDHSEYNEKDYDKETSNKIKKSKVARHCKVCNIDFTTKAEYKKHSNEKHPLTKYECEICGQKFKIEEMYDSHMNVHNGLPAFQCQFCDKTFNFKSNFQTHMFLHTDERPFICDLCSKGFRTKWDLIMHLRCHNDIRKYECDICGKRFRVSSHMTAHKYSHSEDKPFECDICHQNYNSPRTLKQHKKTVHSNIFPYSCKYCENKFKRKHHLVNHLRCHLPK